MLKQDQRVLQVSKLQTSQKHENDPGGNPNRSLANDPRHHQGVGGCDERSEAGMEMSFPGLGQEGEDALRGPERI